MVVSRIFPIFNRLNLCVVNFPKSHLSKIDDNFLKKQFNLAKANPVFLRNMCDDTDKELDDRRRHFDYNQLVEKQKQENVCVIDVREYSELRETGKIPGSINVPLGELKKALKEMTPEEFKRHYQGIKPGKGDQIIFSCKSGNRSLKALRIGLELGYCKSGNYAGGWTDWAEKSKKQQD